MPVTRRVPKYRHNTTTDRAVVTLNGVDHWLGKYGTDESRQKYDRLIAQWLANDRQVPRVKHAADVTVIELVAKFWAHCEAFYKKPDGSPTTEVANFRHALKPLKALYGYSKAAEFGPQSLKAVRQRMIDMGWCRTFINKQIARLKHVFQWGVSQELIPPTVHQALQTLKGLRKGKTDARESKKVRPVDPAHVEGVKDHVSAQVWAMIRLQLVTGMRPTEVCIMRGCDIDMADPKLWMYTPQFHKTEHHGHDRTVFLGPQAQEVITPFLKPNPQAYLFSPKDAEAARYAKAKTHRRPDQKPNERETDRCLRDRYDKDTYRRAIARACEKADKKARKQRRELMAEKGIELDPAHDVRVIPHWHPHQLRHTAATRLRREYGLEASRCILGQTTLTAAQVYAEQDVQRARQIMAQVG
jgi:integrase